MGDYTILITGANSGLGLSTCQRLIDEWLSTRPASQSLHIIFTTRSPSKRDATLSTLGAHLDRTIASVYGTEAKTAGIRELQKKRVRIEGLLADLCDLTSVKRLADALKGRGQKVDVLICNAGIGGWKGIDWLPATWAMLTNILEATTFPRFKIGEVGKTVKSAAADAKNDVAEAEQNVGHAGDVLGETFTSNVFGHYILASRLAPLMVRKEKEAPARIVWISSIEAFEKFFDLDDMQALEVAHSYESSKRLTDLLALTSDMPSTRTYLESFYSAGSGSRSNSPKMRDSTELVVVENDTTVHPRMYLSHPGVCVTSISGIHWFLVYFFTASLYLARWLGSPWHPISSYTGAVSTVWLALTGADILDGLEGEQGKGKWGAATDRIGNERAVRTEVDGWGFGGKEGETADGIWRVEARRGTNKVVTKDEREDFAVKGARVWKEMESLRQHWEHKLDRL
ncbi:hypothetical protein CAC42_62 [Sphaceloma murrayae]|uniref:Uncharacterized protein n=1 Tax=Sphaceloma murrayae TaxID=2082308 RepID=A0A2K1QNJ5_9PEZI|nr:hypothetical protein CAC42_62 [Sphaceloma murrayae]